MKNSKEFIKIFNALEHYLNKLVNKPCYLRFSELLEEASKINPAVREYANDLREFAELRNAIVHAPTGKIIAEVFSSTVEKFKKIYKRIKTPLKAYEIASRPVYCCDLDDSLSLQIKVMRRKTYTHVPVYHGDLFIGVLSESSIFNWLSDLTRLDLDFNKLKVKDIKKYLSIQNRPNEYFKFVSKHANAYLIKQWFNESIRENKRLGAVFVTQTGAKDEKILGIITAWDLPRIK